TDSSAWGVTVGYSYHLPPTWYLQPNRKFPVIYSFHGGGVSENSMWELNWGPEPLADSWYSEVPSGPAPLNWGKDAPCVLIFPNITKRNYGFDAKPGSPMYGKLMTYSEVNELIDHVELNEPMFRGRLVPQGNNDPNGARGRGINGG